MSKLGVLTTISAAIAPESVDTDTKVIDASELVLLPGAIDLLVQREPSRECKADRFTIPSVQRGVKIPRQD